MGLLAIMAICSGCLCWQKMSDNETKNANSGVTRGIDQFSEGGARNSINIMVTENEGVHLQVEHGNGNPLLHDDYTQEGGDDHGMTITDEKENNYNANDYNNDVLKESGDTMRDKGEMFQQDLNDEVVVENALMDDIVGHVATSGKSDI